MCAQFKVFKNKAEAGMLRGADPDGLRALVTQHADKFAGEGQKLGGSAEAEEAGLSEREKRAAALARRGL